MNVCRAGLATVERAEETPVESLPDNTLTPELIIELGRILGEALVLQYQQDTADIVRTRTGANHEGGKLQ